jgi:hypothetical protein
MSDTFSDNKKIANVIIAKDLDEAPIQVQIQALELMRTGYIYTRTSVQTAPKRFLFIALIAGGEGPRLTKHLNDYMFISHFHDPEDGFPNLEDLETDGDSISSVVRKNTIDHLIEAASDPLFSASVGSPHACTSCPPPLTTARMLKPWNRPAARLKSVLRLCGTCKTSSHFFVCTVLSPVESLPAQPNSLISS